jgi:multiple sugar transport system substrate-binding protein
VQTAINGPDGLGQLPVNANASVADDEFIQQGFEMLSNNATGGIAQFFDRDWPAEMASARHGRPAGIHGLPRQPRRHPRASRSARQRIYQ